MHVGSDFFRWMAFVVKLIHLFISVFGDDDEKEVEKNNHIEA